MGQGHRAIIERVEARRLLAATVSGLAFNDKNNDSIRQTGEDWFEVDGENATQVTIYADANGNGLFDSTEPNAKLSAAGTYTINLPTAGVYAIRGTYTINAANQDSAIYTPVNVIVVSDGQNLTNQNMPSREGAIFTGRVYIDEDADGTHDTAEPVRGFGSAFYDVNNDGIWQNNEPFAPLLQQTSGSPAYTYQLPVPNGAGTISARLFDATTLVATKVSINPEIGDDTTQDIAFTPEMRIGGKVFGDSDRNRKRSGSERYLAGIRVWLDYNNDGKWDKKAGEPSSLTNEAGEYNLLHRKTSIMSPRIAFRSSETNTLTSTAKSLQAKFSSIQQTMEGVRYGLAPAQIRMRVYNDRNSDQSLNVGDFALAGVTVYIDRDGDNKQDKNEQVAVTDADGYVTFNIDVTPSPRVFTLRLRYSSKWTASTDQTPLASVQIYQWQTVPLFVGLKST